jgi:diguanylate cyclase (GGDEF)-like protein/PAS domain S-box-containing protein
VNPALCRMLGRSPEWLLARRMSDVLASRFDEEDRRLRDDLLAGRTRTATTEVRIECPAGEEIWAEHSIGLLLDPDGTPQSYVSQFFDVTDAKRGREQLAYLADHDAVTRLLSRRALLAALERIDRHPPRSGTLTGALFIDIDRFKDVNDSYGHAVGDQVLAAVAGRISASARSDDLVARLGGDEIVVALPNLHGTADAEAVAAKIHTTLAEPVAAGDVTVPVTVSIGVAVRDPGEEVERVITKADRALYRAKRSGRNRTVRYDPRQDEP